jgi:uncharacterized protein YrrD
MRYAKGTEVFTAMGEKIGTISRIVIDAKTKDVTDLVVEQGGLLGKDEKVIPVGLVDLEYEDRITLRETNQGVDEFPNYETTHYVPVEQPGAEHENIETAYWYPPLNVQIQLPRAGVFPGGIPDQVPQTETSIPEGRIAISEGAQVVSADEKHIGNVEQVITNSETNTVTHFVIGKGFLLKEHKLVPAFWVDNVEEDKIHLSVDARLFDRLPVYNPD